MKLFMFAIKDRCTDLYGTPMFMVSAGQAQRSFSDEVNREATDNQLYQHPDDFDLYTLGSWESETGEFFAEVPHLLCRGKDLVINYQPEKSAKLRGVN